MQRVGGWGGVAGVRVILYDGYGSVRQCCTSNIDFNRDIPQAFFAVRNSTWSNVRNPHEALNKE